MAEKCDHKFIQGPSCVQELLENFERNPNAESIGKARDILHNCPECALFFYQELLFLLKEIVPNKTTEKEKKEYIVPWTFYSIGFSLKEIEEKFCIPKTTVRDRVAKVNNYLIDIDAAFYV